jgi:hypothetical protein
MDIGLCKTNFVHGNTGGNCQLDDNNIKYTMIQFFSSPSMHLELGDVRSLDTNDTNE